MSHGGGGEDMSSRMTGNKSGSDDVIYGSDDQPMSLINFIIEPGRHSMILHGKPKLFFV
jgi:hypothetical protein